MCEVKYSFVLFDIFQEIDFVIIGKSLSWEAGEWDKESHVSFQSGQTGTGQRWIQQGPDGPGEEEFGGKYGGLEERNRDVRK